jgi:transposase, IS5 family
VPQDELGYYRREYRRDSYAANVILSAVGYNLRLVLAWLRRILRVVLLALFQTFAIRPALKPVF